MADLQHAIRSGHYAQHQIHSSDRLIAWSHRRRFRTALALAREYAGRRVLDYGCGDGTFLALLTTSPWAPESAVGAELHLATIADCQRRFAEERRLRFILTHDLQRSDEAGRYDAIFCMEVCEHVVDPEPLFDQFERLLARDGTLVISVPIETGLPVIVKQLVRRLAGWRGIGHYPGTTGYTPTELLKSVLAGATQHIPRPIFSHEDNTTFHDHKGFNWRVLRRMLRDRFDLVRELSSPLSWLGPQAGAQRWFVARRRRLTPGVAGQSSFHTEARNRLVARQGRQVLSIKSLRPLRFSAPFASKT